jgi:peptidyl-prolyl cis-trans isomerase B (cyclophilin B)
MKNIVLLAAALLLFAAVAASPVCSENIRYRKFSDEEIAEMKSLRAVIRTPLGDMTLRFFPESAPNHVNNFTVLARKGFYDGTTFHRVIPGFMIQGGDPLSKNADRSLHGTGGPGYQLKAEFNDRPHKRGTVSMARSRHPDSAGSQFFICAADAPHLDGQYTVFGQVVQGMTAADKIISQKTDQRNNPLEPIPMEIDIRSETQ